MKKLANSAALVALSCFLAPAVSAGICDGLTGEALGLCQAGVAVGCDSGTGPEQACTKLEEKFQDTTGEPAPWIASCPCDFSQVSLALESNRGPWPDEGEYHFICTEMPDAGPVGGRGATFNSSHAAVANKLNAELRYDANGLPASGFCLVAVNSVVLENIAFPSSNVLNLARACREDVITYGNAFIALHPSVEITTLNCTE